MNGHWDLVRRKYPGVGWYLTKNGFLVFSGTERECRDFAASFGVVLP